MESLSSAVSDPGRVYAAGRNSINSRCNFLAIYPASLVEIWQWDGADDYGDVFHCRRRVMSHTLLTDSMTFATQL